MHLQKFLELIGNGRFFTCAFVKKDGSKRILNGRSGVKRYVKGVGMSYVPADKGLATVFDTQKREYRSIKTDSVEYLIANGRVYDKDGNVVSAGTVLL